ncbi:unnamed protein product [Rangifer tarandus platyrhynchus]|uniref:Uncharacterized protein n=2 Tax=Rangifer tarandus platyrhynchus TaxID=3082113 RepID=A0ABN8ZF12_RANTA|nr:unnamed protein product [Rangifer tarandus platyrhynchus]CAI9708429.1 unnamed protein product [Rangifer tarandus platyrhynchus]
MRPAPGARPPALRSLAGAGRPDLDQRGRAAPDLRRAGRWVLPSPIHGDLETLTGGSCFHRLLPARCVHLPGKW